jgi:lantibiotic biosynthesis protein
VLPRLCAWAARLIDEGDCQKIAFESYDREVERYGGPAASAVAEALFAIDSRAVAELLACAANVDRMLLLIASTDDLLGALGLDAAARLKWLRESVSWRNEVGEEYRARRNNLITALRDRTKIGAAIRDVFDWRRDALAPIVHQLSELQTAGVVTRSFSTLCDSYVHMHCNRMWGDPLAERRARALLLRTRDTLAHLPEDMAVEQPILAASINAAPVDTHPHQA